MALQPDEVRHVARLARLDLTDDEVAALAPQLSAILGYAEHVSELDTDGVEPMIHPHELKNVMRPDIPGEPLDREELLSQAPEQDLNRFAVPRIVAEEG